MPRSAAAWISTVVVAIVTLLFASALALTACGDKPTPDAEPFDTLKACFDDHHSGAESLPVAQAITVCCLDHPIAGVHPSCKDTQADCVAHVTQELGTSATASDIQAACTDYIKNLP